MEDCTYFLPLHCSQFRILYLEPKLLLSNLLLRVQGQFQFQTLWSAMFPSRLWTEPYICVCKITLHLAARVNVLSLHPTIRDYTLYSQCELMPTVMPAGAHCTLQLGLAHWRSCKPYLRIWRRRTGWSM